MPFINNGRGRDECSCRFARGHWVCGARIGDVYFREGSDAIPLEWSPLVSSELPKFVYGCSRKNHDRGRAEDTKAVFRTLQRMETPVIYFYSDQPRTIDVAVRFPQGEITEWYPQKGTLSRSRGGPTIGATARPAMVQCGNSGSE